MTKSDSELAKFAKQYAAQGLRIHPLKPAGKEPFSAHGSKDATTDQSQIEAWWAKTPDANIGMATGAGLVVLDIDGEKGAQALAALEAVHAPLPPTQVQVTGRGKHYFFEVNEPIKNSTGRIGTGIDVRGDGGHVVVAPSVHPTGAIYRWERGRSPLQIKLAPAPPWLLVAMKQPPRPIKSRDAVAGTWPTRARHGLVATECAKVSAAPEGTRNDQLNASAFSLGRQVGAGIVDAELATSSLKAAARLAGLQEDEITRTIASSIAAGKTDPVVLPNPVPLLRKTRPGQEYPTAALGALAAPALAIHEMTQAPVAIAAQSVLGVAALAAQGIGDTELLIGKCPTSLYLLTIAASGERKSSCDRLAMYPVTEFQKKLAANHRVETERFKNELSLYEAKRNAVIKRCKNSFDDADAEISKLGNEPKPPLHPALVASDPTYEGLTKFMLFGRPSIGIISDEGGTFIGGYAMNQENRLKTLAGLSGLWNASEVTRWRAGDGVALIVGRRISMHLMAQETAAASLLSDPIANDQGFLSRCLLSQPQSAIGTRTRTTRDETSLPTINRYAEKIRKMLSVPLPLQEGTQNELDPPLVKMTSESRDCLLEFALEIEIGQQQDGPYHAARPFASKAAEHAARIATVLALYEDPAVRSVDVVYMERGITLARYYLSEALRLADASVIPAYVADAERLRRWLLDRWSEDYISATDITQRGPFKVTARARSAVETLVKHDWLAPVTGGASILGKRRRTAWKIIRQPDDDGAVE